MGHTKEKMRKAGWTKSNKKRVAGFIDEEFDTDFHLPQDATSLDRKKAKSKLRGIVSSGGHYEDED